MFELQISEQMMAVIAEALSNHRFKDAAPVITELQRQINNQRPRTNGRADEQAASVSKPQ